ncbi:unnamed protein product [Euphydryas editha]|uniref:Uncharacterized protein n=1 Tax=Euphydryas editha TaxID=104508 RepID=A0AAU9V5M6_EUPED|nr:unnamed protein product [Euphydryas editha]
MGGVTVLLAGDFRPTLPVVPRGTRPFWCSGASSRLNASPQCWWSRVQFPLGSDVCICANICYRSGCMSLWVYIIFMKIKIEYLGFVISSGQIRPNPRKIEALKTLPTPSTVTK